MSITLTILHLNEKRVILSGSYIRDNLLQEYEGP